MGLHWWVGASHARSSSEVNLWEVVVHCLSSHGYPEVKGGMKRVSMTGPLTIKHEKCAQSGSFASMPCRPFSMEAISLSLRKTPTP